MSNNCYEQIPSRSFLRSEEQNRINKWYYLQLLFLWCLPICEFAVIDSLLDNTPQFSHFHINSLHIKSWILQKAGQGFIWVAKCCVSDDPLFSSGKISMFSSEMLFLYSFVYGRFAISIWKKLQSRNTQTWMCYTTKYQIVTSSFFIVYFMIFRTFTKSFIFMSHFSTVKASLFFTILFK